MTEPVETIPPSELAPTDEDAQMAEFLGFQIGDEPYALPLSSVREILRPPPVTEVPRGPAAVLGIISVRGQVTTLVDLRRRLKMPEREIDGRSRVLLVARGSEVMGLLVDRVLQVYRIREDEMELASVLGTDTSNYIMGIGRPGFYDNQARVGGREKVRSGEALARGEILILIDPLALLKPYGAA